MKLVVIILLIGCTAPKRTMITLTTIRLDGSRSRVIDGNGKGFIKTWNWRQISGPSYPIDNSKAMITHTKVGPGSYAWELTGIDDQGNIGKDTFYFKK